VFSSTAYWQTTQASYRIKNTIAGPPFTQTGVSRCPTESSSGHKWYRGIAQWELHFDFQRQETLETKVDGISVGACCSFILRIHLGFLTFLQHWEFGFSDR
jgi:hypothetical protein